MFLAALGGFCIASNKISGQIRWRLLRGFVTSLVFLKNKDSSIQPLGGQADPQFEHHVGITLRNIEDKNVCAMAAIQQHVEHISTMHCTQPGRVADDGLKFLPLEPFVQRVG